MRIPAEDALRLKIIDEKTARTMKDGKRSGLTLGAAVARLNPQVAAELAKSTTQTKGAGPRRQTSAASSGSKEYLGSERSPQAILFRALQARMPGVPVWEAQGLIPGRKYRTDIFIPPKVVIEMDGFAFHRDLESFKKDRQKQNLYVANGFLPIRAYAAQIFDQQMLEELVELIVQTALLPSVDLRPAVAPG